MGNSRVGSVGVDGTVEPETSCRSLEGGPSFFPSFLLCCVGVATLSLASLGFSSLAFLGSPSSLPWEPLPGWALPAAALLFAPPGLGFIASLSRGINQAGTRDGARARPGPATARAKPQRSLCAAAAFWVLDPASCVTVAADPAFSCSSPFRDLPALRSPRPLLGPGCLPELAQLAGIGGDCWIRAAAGAAAMRCNSAEAPVLVCAS